MILNPIRLLSVCRFSGRLCQFGEGRRVLQRDVGQNFAVEIDTGYLEAVNQLIVVETVFTGRSANADNPEFSKLALADPSVTVGVT